MDSSTASWVVPLIGGLVDMFGSFHNSAVMDKRLDEQNKLLKEQINLQKQAYTAQLNFGEKLWNKWKSLFGDTQEQLAEYYRNLTDENLKAKFDMANINANNSLLSQYNEAKSSLEKQFKRQNMSNTGANIAANLQLQNSMLQQQATNNWNTEMAKATAEEQVMSQKAGWVQQGDNLFTQASNIIVGAHNNLGNAAGNQAQITQQYVNMLQNNKDNIWGNYMEKLSGQLYGFGTEAIKSYYDTKDKPNSTKNALDSNNIVVNLGLPNTTDTTVYKPANLNQQQNYNLAINGGVSRWG